MTPWPPVRIGAVIGIGLVVIYWLGRWDAGIDLEDQRLAEETTTFLAQARVSRFLRDSLREAEDVLLLRDSEIRAQTGRHRQELARLVEQGRRRVADLESLPVDSLLRSLRLTPIRVSPDSTIYATDSSGVRVLARGMLRLEQLERQSVVRDSLARADSTRIAGLILLSAARGIRADTAEADLRIAEDLLERYLRRSGCKILWLIPCPSRKVSLIAGLTAGAIIVGVLKE